MSDSVSQAVRVELFNACYVQELLHADTTNIRSQEAVTCEHQLAYTESSDTELSHAQSCIELQTEEIHWSSVIICRLKQGELFQEYALSTSVYN